MLQDNLIIDRNYHGSGFNGENNLIKEIIIYQCKRKSSMKKKTCDEASELGCTKIIFLWKPGSNGEMFEENSGILVENDKSFLLEITYNSGTGWLLDQSGLDLFYSKSNLENEVRYLKRNIADGNFFR